MSALTSVLCSLFSMLILLQFKDTAIFKDLWDFHIHNCTIKCVLPLGLCTVYEIPPWASQEYCSAGKTINKCCLYFKWDL